jgi:hypothetical protein
MFSASRCTRVTVSTSLIHGKYYSSKKTRATASQVEKHRRPVSLSRDMAEADMVAGFHYIEAKAG